MIYYVPTKIHFGTNSLNELENIVKGYKPKKTLLISGRNFFRESGLQKKVLTLLQDYNIVQYNEVNSVPKTEDIDNALNYAREENPDLIIGIGGGSVLDTAKIISMTSKNSDKIMNYVGKNLDNKSLPFIAIPTTSGTGSEVTPFAVFYDNNIKQSFGSIHDYLAYPDHAIVDPELTITMSRELTASSGLDALSQAFESYWSVNSNPLSDTHAIQSIKLILKDIDHFYKNRDDKRARFNMSRASLEAGLAFSQTATTAPHAVSYPMTAHLNLSHGFACAITLPEFLLYNYNLEEDCLDKRGKDFVKNRLEELACYHLGFHSVDRLYKGIKGLMKDINAPLTLGEIGISDFDIIMEEGFTPKRMNNNPRLVTKESLKEILEKIR